MSRALKDAEKRLKAEPQNLGLRVQVAGLMREAGRSTEAVELYRSVALAYRDQGRKNQAIMVCRSILEIAPDDVACNSLLYELAGSQAAAPTSSPPPNPSVPTLRPPPSRSQSPAVSRAPTPSRPPVVSRAPTPSRPPMPIAPPASRTSSQRSIQIPPRDSDRKVGSKGPLAPTDTLRGITPRAAVPKPPPLKNEYSSRDTLRNDPRAESVTNDKSPRDKSDKLRTAARLATDAGTPPPAASRAATAPPPPPAAAARLPLEPPARRSSGQTTNPDAARRSSVPTNPDMSRRSSGEMTPLPKAIPHHLYDPTHRNKRISADDIDSHDTNPDAQPRARTPSSAGLAEAARKITALIKPEEDVAGPMDTRPVRKIKSEELRKITQPPPTGEHARLSDEEIQTQLHDAQTKPGPGDDELTTPRDLIDDDDD